MDETKCNKSHNMGDSKRISKEGRPVPPLSAYDIFVHLEKKAYSKKESGSSSKTSPTEASFASRVSAKWKNTGTALKTGLEELAQLDRERYDHESEEWEMSSEVQAPKTPKSMNPFVPGEIAQLAPAKKRTSFDKKNFGGIALPSTPLKAASGARHNTERDTKLAPLQGGFLSQGKGSEMARSGVSSGDAPVKSRSILQVENARFSSRPNGNLSFAIPSEASTGASLQPNASTTLNDANDNAMKSAESQSMHVDTRELQYMRGFLQGYKMQPDFAAASRKVHFVPLSLSDLDDSAFKNSFQQVKDEDIDDPSFIRGFAQGYNTASQMWSTGW